MKNTWIKREKSENGSIPFSMLLRLSFKARNARNSSGIRLGRVRDYVHNIEFWLSGPVFFIVCVSSCFIFSTSLFNSFYSGFFLTLCVFSLSCTLALSLALLFFLSLDISFSLLFFLTLSPFLAYISFSPCRSVYQSAHYYPPFHYNYIRSD